MWRDVTFSAFCSAGAQMPLVDSFTVFHSLAQRASGWLPMLAVMTPLIVAPLRHVRERSFAHRRVRAMVLFVIGYGAVWMIAGLGLQILPGQILALQILMPQVMALAAQAALLSAGIRGAIGWGGGSGGL